MGEAKRRGSAEERRRQAQEAGRTRPAGFGRGGGNDGDAQPVPHVPAESLAQLVAQGMAEITQFKDYEAAIPTYFKAITKIGMKDGMAGGPVTMRALCFLYALVDHGQRLEEEGVLIRRSTSTEAGREYFEGVARVPLKMSLDGEKLALQYDIDDLVLECKRYAGPGLRPGIAKFGSGDKRGQFIGGSMAEMLRTHGLDAGVFDDVTGEADLTVFEGDFPQQDAIDKTRAAALSLIPAEDAWAFDNEVRDKSDKILVMATVMVTVLGAEMASMMGFGPWMVYLPLDSGKNWDFGKYLALVRRSAHHAQVPCKAGRFPAHYVGVHGTAGEFAQVLALAGNALDQLDPDGRPLLIDLIMLNDSSEKIQILLARGVDVDQPNNYGHTPVGTAIRCGNFAVLKLLLDAGADLFADALLDREIVSLAMQSPKCPGYMRLILQGLYEALPIEPAVSPEPFGPLSKAADRRYN